MSLQLSPAEHEQTTHTGEETPAGAEGIVGIVQDWIGPVPPGRGTERL